jgi:hypothetical protein
MDYIYKVEVSCFKEDGWYEVNGYNEDGILESTTYEKA